MVDCDKNSMCIKNLQHKLTGGYRGKSYISDFVNEWIL
jgi:hypothetical protein